MSRVLCTRSIFQVLWTRGVQMVAGDSIPTSFGARFHPGLMWKPASAHPLSVRGGLGWGRGIKVNLSSKSALTKWIENQAPKPVPVISAISILFFHVFFFVRRSCLTYWKMKWVWHERKLYKKKCSLLFTGGGEALKVRLWSCQVVC